MTTADEAVQGFLLGGDNSVSPGLPHFAGFATGTTGLLRRLMEAYGGQPVGPGQQLAVGAAVGRLTVPDLAVSAIVTVEVQGVRMKADGDAPTATVGPLFTVGTVLQLTGVPTMKAAAFIGVAAGAIIDVAYFA